jgi:hypothetical protein
MMTTTDAKIEKHELLDDLDAPDAEPLAPVEMGRADRETQGGFWGLADFHFGFQG